MVPDKITFFKSACDAPYVRGRFLPFATIDSGSLQIADNRRLLVLRGHKEHKAVSLTCGLAGCVLSCAASMLVYARDARQLDLRVAAVSVLYRLGWSGRSGHPIGWGVCGGSNMPK